MAKVTKLRNVTVPRKGLELSTGHYIEIRGINASDLILLTSMFGPQMAMAYGKVKSEMGKGKQSQLDYYSLLKVVKAITNEAPQMLAWVMAIANDDPSEEAAEMVAQLPLIDQTAILESVINETMANESTVKKLVESLSGMYLTISGAVMGELDRQANTPTGTGPSAVN